jgi:hypothetical protein
MRCAASVARTMRRRPIYGLKGVERNEASV